MTLMGNRAALVLAAMLGLSACSAPYGTQNTGKEAQEAAIKAVLAAQQAAWNACDIDGFMDGYWRSPELRFASGGAITHGWQQTRDGYKARYGDCAKMGRLDFSGLQVTVFSNAAAQVFGHWRLTRPGGHPHGLFTLTFAKKAGHWRIVADHTSAAAP